MSFDPATHTKTAAKWLDGGILELRTHLGANQAHRWDGLVIEQGRSLYLPISWVAESGALNLSSGYTAALQIRLTPGASGAALLGLTQSSGITLGASAPNIIVRMTTVQTGAFTFSRAWYELTVTHTASSTAHRLLHGACELSRKVIA